MRSPCDNLIETLKSFNPDLGDMRLKNAVYKNGAVKINLISDITISEKDVEFLKSSFEKELSGISVTVETHKSLADADIAKRAIYNY
ncbi:MAG: hypothetical protein J6V66_02000, partial [Clostridia bacterium]|nr:hypothetical protein [Clostridia bacterium]